MSVASKIIKYRKVIVILWIIAIALSVPIFRKLDEILVYEEESFLPPTAESAIVSKLLKEEFKEAPPTPYYMLLITGLNVSDPKFKELYMKFEEMVYREKLMKNLISYYDLLNDIESLAHDALYNVTVMLHNGTLMLKSMLEQVNSSYKLLYDNITRLPEYINKLYNYTLLFDKIYTTLHENLTLLSEVYNNLDRYIEQLDEAFNRTLQLTMYMNITSTYIHMLNDTFSEAYSRFTNFSRYVEITRDMLIELDKAYSETYDMMCKLYNALNVTYEGALRFNSILYQLPYYYIITYFNVSRTHYYLLSIYNYSRLPSITVMKEVTDLSSLNPKLGPVSKDLVIYLYFEIKGKFKDPSKVNEHHLNNITKKIMEMAISKIVPEEYMDVVKVYLNAISSTWDNIIDELMEDGGILKWYVYDKENMTNTRLSQLKVYYKLIDKYNELLSSSITKSKNEIAYIIASKFNVPFDVALGIIDIALDIGYPTNETKARELVVELYANMLKDKIGEVPGLDYKGLIEFLWRHGASPKLALNITRVIACKYIDELEIPEDIISKKDVKEKVLPLVINAIGRYDPEAEGIIASGVKLKELTIYTMIRIIEVLGIEVPQELPGISVYDVLEAVYDYVDKGDDKPIRMLIEKVMKGYLEEFIPQEYSMIAEKLVIYTCTLWPINSSEELLIVEDCFSYVINVMGVEVPFNVSTVIVKYYDKVKHAENETELRAIAWNILIDSLVRLNTTSALMVEVFKTSNVFTVKIEEILVREGKWLHENINVIKEAFDKYLVEVLTSYSFYNVTLSKETAEKVVNLIASNKTLDATKTILNETLTDILSKYNATFIVSYLLAQEPGFTSNKTLVKEIIIVAMLSEFKKRFKDFVSDELMRFTLSVVYGPKDTPRESISPELASNLTKMLLKDSALRYIEEQDIIEEYGINETMVKELIDEVCSRLPLTNSELKDLIVDKISSQAGEYMKEYVKNAKEVKLNITSIILDVYDLGENATKQDYEAIVSKYLDSIVNDILAKSKELLDVLVSEDKDTILISMETYEDPDSDTAFNKALKVREIAKEIFEKEANCKVYLTGPKPLLTDVMKHAKKDRELVDRLSVVLVAVILFSVIGGILALLMPMMGIVSSIIISSAILYLTIARITDIHIWSRIVMITTALGLGVDYSTYLMSRFKEEISKGRSKEEAATIALSRSAPAILAAATTDMAGFGVLAIAWDFPFLRSLGVTIPVAIFMVLMAGLTLIPSILAMIGGSKAFWWPRGIKPINATRKSRLVEKVVNRAGIVIALFIVISLASAYLYITTFKPSHEYSIALPEGAESAQGLEVLKKELKPGVLAPVYVILEFKDNATSEQALKAIEEISQFIDLLPYTTIVYGPTRPNGTIIPSITLDTVKEMGGLRYVSGNKVLLKVALNASPDSEQATEFLREFRKDLKNMVSKEYSGLISNVYVGGFTATEVDLDMFLENIFWSKIFPAAFIAMFILLTLTLRTVVGALLALVLIGSTILWGIALTTLTFKVILGIPIIWFLPIMVFSIILGVGMDYFSFYIVRVMEESKNKPVKEALAVAGGAVSKIIIGLALIVCGAYATLLLASMKLLKELGFALTASIFIISILTSYTVLPAIISKLGEKAWWPRKIK